MSDYVPYSEKQKIFEPADWEGMHFLDQDCPTAKKATELMRAVVSRLLRIDKDGKNVDINDFEFLIYDDPSPNAAFVSNSQTKNGKYVVMISTGIMKLCKTEDEFAGVLSHELGHFTYDKVFGNNENTVGQERFSDIHALDLMIAGGYDPAAYSNVCDQFRTSYQASVLFDVHGSSFARGEDVKTYLTYLHEKKLGTFTIEKPTGLWDDFVKIITSHRDKYKSYFTQALEHKFPNTKNNNKKPEITQLFDFIISEMASDKLNNSQRISDVNGYIESYSKSDKPKIKATQKFFEQFMQLYMTQDVKIRKDWAIYNIFRNIKNKFRDDQYFNVCEPFKHDIDILNEFITTRDPDRIRQLYDNHIYNMSQHGCYAGMMINSIQDLFGEPHGFQMPPRESAKNSIMPTDLHVSQRVDNHVFSTIGMIQQGYDEWLTDSGLNGGSNYAGKIISIDPDEIEKLRHEAQLKKDVKKREQRYEINHQKFIAYMEILNDLYAFKTGKKRASDIVNYYQTQKNNNKYWLRSFWDDFFNGLDIGDFNNENKYFQSEINQLKTSQAFTELCVKPYIQTLHNAIHWVLPDLEEVLDFEPAPGESWLDCLTHILSVMGPRKEKNINVGEYLYRGHYMYDAINPASWGYGNAGSMESAFSVFSDLLETAHRETGMYKQELEKFYGIDYRFQVFDFRFIENRLNLNLDMQRSRCADKWIKYTAEQQTIYADKQDWMYPYRKLSDTLDNDIAKGDLHVLHRMLKTTGMLATNEQDLIRVLNQRDEKNQPMPAHIMANAFLYYIRKDYPIHDLYSILFALRSAKNAIDAGYTDELADYITKHNLFPSDLKSRYDLYVLMESMDVFSKEKSNQSKLLNLMLEQIKKLPDAEKHDYAYKLLSGFYFPDNSAASKDNRTSRTMDFPLVKEQLLEIYSDLIAKKMGRDDNSDAYLAKVQDFIQFINTPHQCYDKDTNDNDRTAFNKNDLGALYRLISDKIQSQERVSQAFANNKNIAVSDKDFQDSDMYGRDVEGALDVLQRNPELSIYAIEFLNTKLTNKSIQDFRNKCSKFAKNNDRVAQAIKPSVLENLYNTFWSSGLEIRTYIMTKLLNRGFGNLDDKIKYVCDMNFDKNSEYYQDALLVFDCVIKAFRDFSQDNILAAIASADKNKQEGQTASRSVGEALCMFFENMGPAWVKFGQLLSYVPELPSEIRHDLGKLKDQADIPARWDLYQWMHNVLPNDLYNRIERVENIVGAGSFWITAVVQLRGDDGKTEKKVIQILRENAASRSDAGFETIERAISELSKRKKSYKMLQSVAHQAHESSKYEVDVNVGNKQYEKAKELYGDIRVEIDGTTYTPHVADWRHYGSNPDGMGYKIMDYASGNTLSRIKASEEERRKMALAYFTIEMTNLFKGDVWDIDRHQGQQNFERTSDTNVDINIYDTGAQLPQGPNKVNKVLLASVFFGLITAVQNNKPIDAYLLKKIKQLDKLQNKAKINVSYVSNVQKGLMALSDIIEYQKELKGPDGNIIQNRKSLSGEDLKNAIVAVLQNPTVDKWLRVVIMGRYVSHKLTTGELKTLKSLATNSKQDEKNPIHINIVDDNVITLSGALLNKSIDEIKASENPDDYILGINKQHIKSNDNTVLGELKKLGMSIGN